MKLGEIITIINGAELNKTGAHEYDIKGACGADLMSDVLASVQPDAILLTGLCNPQVIRTAQMADVRAIVLVRGKNPPTETVKLADAEGIPLISTPFGMFEVCGRLYKAGLPSFENAIA